MCEPAGSSLEARLHSGCIVPHIDADLGHRRVHISPLSTSRPTVSSILLLLKSGGLLLLLLLPLLDQHVVASVGLGIDISALYVLSASFLVDDVACLGIPQLANLVLLFVFVRLLSFACRRLIWPVSLIVSIVVILLVYFLGQI